METATGLHFVLMTSPAVTTAGACLLQLYSEAFVPFVVRNPFAEREGRITNPAFVKQVDKIVLEGVLSVQLQAEQSRRRVEPQSPRRG